MKVIYRGQRKHTKHQLHISTWQVPNFIEKWLLIKSPQVVNYVGSGTKWFVMQLGEVNPLEYTPVKDPVLIQWLSDIQEGRIKYDDKL